jgi:hypothetical protein
VNKKKLQEFATWAKQNLERQIELSLKKIGIYSDSDIKQSKVQGDVTIIEGVETTFKKQFNNQREEIINVIKDDGYKHTVEQFASTWFNRIVALRFLEVHDYLDHGFKLFPKGTNTLPEILSKLALVKNDLKLDMRHIEELVSSGKNNEELYRYVLFQQCNALGKALPMLFSSDMSHLEYFIPSPLLFGDTIINKLIEIDEADFKEDVEIIGWLYQFYIAIKKDEVYASKTTITKDTLPAVTQLFTPNWIVKYMAENSIGRIWLESYPSSAIKSEMKYYVDEAKQEPDVEEKLKAIRYQNVNPEDIKIIEPCSGSGHILVYCFDLLLKMYQEKGYNKKDIPSLILKNNLVGFDIDQRATQLASFSLVMRARSIDTKFFDEARYVKPKVYEIIDSKALKDCSYNGKSYKEIIKDYNSKQWKGENQLTEDELKAIESLVELFDDAKVIGSLLKVNHGKYLSIHHKLIENIKDKTLRDIFTSAFFEHEFKDLLAILNVAHYLSQKYNVMITNPPYIGISGLESGPKSYLTQNYPDSKTDMFAMFMETDFVRKNGFTSMINMHSWMFLQSYDRLRFKLLRNKYVDNLLHLGTRAFEMISGEVVQTATFIIREAFASKKSLYIDLTSHNSSDSKQQVFINGNAKAYVTNQDYFLHLPSYVFAYKMTPIIKKAYEKMDRLNSYIRVVQGLNTSDNDLYVRKWSELDVNKISFSAINSNDTYKFKWFPYAKGGGSRKWYGQKEYVVLWENNGKVLKSIKNKNGKIKSRSQNTSLYFQKGLTYSSISNKAISLRVLSNEVFGGGGAGIFSHHNIDSIQGFLNSSVPNYILMQMNNTLNYLINDVLNLPYSRIVDNAYIAKLVSDCVAHSKSDWDSSETSWDFKKHPLLGVGKLTKLFSDYQSITKTNFSILKANEEELNDYFINLYGLQGELMKEVDDKNVFISIADIERDTKSLISYLVGVLMGRYSLSEEGLVFAGGTFDPLRYGSHDVDRDGIIPIYSDISIDGGLVHRITGLIKEVYGKDHYRDNINFIAEALGKKANETSEETLNRYLNDGFYQDHLKTYQKRPIYWMFSSGKSSGFKCLIYMHRYNKDTLAIINASYFQPATTILRNQITEVERQMVSAGDVEKRLLEKKRLMIVEQLNEAREYGQVLDYMANKYVSIDLDDGVKVNYAKFQGIEVTTNNGKVKKDLLIPIK